MSIQKPVNDVCDQHRGVPFRSREISSGYEFAYKLDQIVAKITPLKKRDYYKLMCQKYEIIRGLTD